MKTVEKLDLDIASFGFDLGLEAQFLVNITGVSVS